MRCKRKEVTYEILGCEERVDVQSTLACRGDEQVHGGSHFPKWPGDVCSAVTLPTRAARTPNPPTGMKKLISVILIWIFFFFCVKQQICESIGNILSIKIILVKIIASYFRINPRNCHAVCPCCHFFRINSGCIQVSPALIYFSEHPSTENRSKIPQTAYKTA